MGLALGTTYFQTILEFLPSSTTQLEQENPTLKPRTAECSMILFFSCNQTFLEELIVHPPIPIKDHGALIQVFLDKNNSLKNSLHMPKHSSTRLLVRSELQGKTALVHRFKKQQDDGGWPVAVGFGRSTR
jgi:hypothetical protein